MVELSTKSTIFALVIINCAHQNLFRLSKFLFLKFKEKMMHGCGFTEKAVVFSLNFMNSPFLSNKTLKSPSKPLFFYFSNSFKNTLFDVKFYRQLLINKYFVFILTQHRKKSFTVYIYLFI